MDLLAACRAFTAVAAYGSFTAGAAAVRVPQSVASRRVAALEQRLGGSLLLRTSRTVRLTPFGRAVLPCAQRLLDVEDAFALDVERALAATSLLAVPEGLPLLASVDLVRAASADGSTWDVVTAPPGRRAALVATAQVRAAVLAVPVGEARWRVPLGVAARTSRELPPRRLSDLRPSRARAAAPRRVWVSAEDDVEHVLAPLRGAAAAGGLLPGQVRVGGSQLAALASTMGSDDVVLASATEAERWGMAWRELAEPRLARGYETAAHRAQDGASLLASAGAPLATALGVPAAADHGEAPREVAGR